jgi:hypothetical protein
MISNFGANIRISGRFFRLSPLFLIFALLQKMTPRNTAFWVWLLLLPGLLGSWGGWAQAPHSEERNHGKTSGVLADEWAGHQGHSAGCNMGNKDGDPESESNEPIVPVQRPLFLSSTATTSLNSVVFLGANTPSTLINWFLNELNGCGLHAFIEQHFSSWHMSQLFQRMLRLRTWFTCIMQAQAP